MKESEELVEVSNVKQRGMKYLGWTVSYHSNDASMEGHGKTLGGHRSLSPIRVSFVHKHSTQHIATCLDPLDTLSLDICCPTRPRLYSRWLITISRSTSSSGVASLRLRPSLQEYSYVAAIRQPKHIL